MRGICFLSVLLCQISGRSFPRSSRIARVSWLGWCGAKTSSCLAGTLLPALIGCLADDKQTLFHPFSPVGCQRYCVFPFFPIPYEDESVFVNFLPFLCSRLIRVENGCEATAYSLLVRVATQPGACSPQQGPETRQENSPLVSLEWSQSKPVVELIANSLRATKTAPAKVAQEGRLGKNCPAPQTKACESTLDCTNALSMVIPMGSCQ